ncbi:hypothetical protein A9Z42_0077970 [Trichoderma parareesei]|uniref:SAP domain-containing protein n=1 Tax=Trichoderma parareesei TaxID=858221 RepID=A0A2H2ZHX5_TRIPA|nr:hypothetical protein A9Z42_0077970 [Trichoderma parareesei]
MADYTSLKVPELKKLLAEKKLPQTGNKADLIARLQEDDKKNTASAPEADKPENKEDEINYSDDEATASKPEPEQPAQPVEKPAEEPAAAAAAAAPEEAAQDESKPAEEAGDKPAAEEAPKAAAPSFAMGLSSTTADEELKKRAERAKRFGTELDDETKKLAERAKRFGIDDKEIAGGLDSALPERPLKRGRGRNEGGDGNNRPGKRRGGGGQDRREPSGNERRSARNRGGRDQGGKASGKPKFGSVIEDPVERAKAEKRAARFAAA